MRVETRRLKLRLLEESDIEILSELESDPAAQRYFHANLKTREEIENKLHKFILSYKEHGLPWFLIVEPELNELMGRIGLWRYKTGEIEVGYALHKKFWGQGYGTEALSAVLKWAKQNVDANYVIAVATVNNIASLRVLEKCGMQFYKMDIDEGEMCQFYRINNREV